jgi:hypothetical protein
MKIYKLLGLTTVALTSVGLMSLVSCSKASPVIDAPDVEINNAVEFTLPDIKFVNLIAFDEPINLTMKTFKDVFNLNFGSLD